MGKERRSWKDNPVVSDRHLCSACYVPALGTHGREVPTCVLASPSPFSGHSPWPASVHQATLPMMLKSAKCIVTSGLLRLLFFLPGTLFLQIFAWLILTSWPVLKCHLLRKAFPNHLIQLARASRAMTFSHLFMCWVLLKQTQRWSVGCRGGPGLSKSGKINCDASSTKPCPPQQRALQVSIAHQNAPTRAETAGPLCPLFT